MRIAVYARVSTARQAQTQSIEQQLERLQTHCQSRGWELRPENRFRDDGYSGSTLNRPGLDRLRDLVKAGEVDRVLITAPDRLARKYVHPDTLAVLVVGNESAFEKPLSTLGPVTPIDISIPPPVK